MAGISGLNAIISSKYSVRNVSKKWRFFNYFMEAPLNLHIFSLHKYFLWANQMRVHFDDCLKDLKNDSGLVKSSMYMSLWYAGLYVVCEGWKALALKDLVIDELLKSKNLKLLKEFRHSVYHYQKEYYSKKKTMPLIQKGENVIEWVRTLNEQFGRFFLEWFRAHKAKTVTK